VWREKLLDKQNRGCQSSLVCRFFYFLFLFFWLTSGSANQISATLTTPKIPKISKRATLLKEYKAIATSHAVKSYIHSCLDEEDSLKMKLMIVYKQSWLF